MIYEIHKWIIYPVTGILGGHDIILTLLERRWPSKLRTNSRLISPSSLWPHVPPPLLRCSAGPEQCIQSEVLPAGGGSNRSQTRGTSGGIRWLLPMGMAQIWPVHKNKPVPHCWCSHWAKTTPGESVCHVLVKEDTLRCWAHLKIMTPTWINTHMNMLSFFLFF